MQNGRVHICRNIMMSKLKNEFKNKHFTGEIIFWAIRWYCQFAISYRDIVIMATEQGWNLTHTTSMRWVHEYAPKLAKRFSIATANHLVLLILIRLKNISTILWKRITGRRKEEQG